jgi:2-hydroxychromene-2-carboxylate isomerase
VTSQPLFYYDFSSPYAYLAASRVDEVLPVPPVWRPIAFGVIVQRHNKRPWSFRESRDQDFAEIERRGAAYGLPPIRYPEGWPVETYSIPALRLALLGEEEGKLREISRELYRTAFAEGRPLVDTETLLDVAERAGMDREEVRSGIVRDEIKARLRAATEEALERGVTGVPTIAVGERLFWGDDRLEEAAAALRAA